MGILSSMTHTDVEGPPHAHLVTLYIAFDAGGGPGSTSVRATILWNAAQLEIVPGSASPAGATAVAGSITWNNVIVTDPGTNFTVRLQCLDLAVRSSQVTGVAKDLGGSYERTRYDITTTC